jgi:hypothetical protein
MKKPTLMITGLAFALAVAAGTASAAGKPFGNPEDVADGNQLWKILTDARLVGKNSFRPMPYETAPPHGGIVETMDGMLTVRGRTGVVIVKKNFGERDKTTLEQVANQPGKYLTSVTVMFKREKGYDPENKNWFWAKYAPGGKLMKNPKGMALAGRVAKGSDKACIACHKGAPGGDMVFIHDRYAK